MKALLEIYAHNQYNFNLLQFKMGYYDYKYHTFQNATVDIFTKSDYTVIVEKI